ncbi:MAG: M6 family metalloprotease domain-containing protein [Elusimicrobiota bacterium]
MPFKILATVLGLVSFSLLGFDPLAAAPAAPGVRGPSKSPCRLNVPAAQARVKALRSLGVRGAPAAPPAPLNPEVLVIRVDFADDPLGTNFGDASTFYTSVRNFFIENSYNLFQPSFTITVCGTGCGANGAYRLGNKAAYGDDCLLPDDSYDVACRTGDLFDDAVAAANADGRDFSQFDHIMIYHAGPGQETVANPPSPEIWSVFFPLRPSVVLDGKSFNGFTVVPEKQASGFSPLGVIAHEYGHQLGLPDLYDVSVAGGRSTVGAWDVMDYPYTGVVAAGDNPPHLGAWSKTFLGFTTLRTSSGPVTLGAAENSANKGEFIKIPAAGGGAQEYFLLEYRRENEPGAQFDKDLPMPAGLAIWHVDDGVAMNADILRENWVNSPSLNGRGHRGVDLVEADGVEANPQAGDLGRNDAFTNGQSFTTPQSDAFNGAASGAAVTNISGVGGASVSAHVAFIQAAANLTVKKIINYPNPGGDAKKYPARSGAPAGTVTTFVLQLTRPLPPAKLELDIYTPAGERVRSVSGSALALKVGTGEPSEDFKWVYEFDWDGKNESGADAASGVYLYRFLVDGQAKIGKTVLIR